MAVRGTEAKSEVEKRIKEAFGEDYIGIYDKKIYLWANDGTERVQIALSMTCPKNNVGVVDATAGAGHDFTTDNTVVAPTKFEPAEITEEEKKNVADLLASLGL